MNAIRRDEEMDNLHSVYVDQWDWEKPSFPSGRTATSEFLRQTVRATLWASVVRDQRRPAGIAFPSLHVPVLDR